MPPIPFRARVLTAAVALALGLAALPATPASSLPAQSPDADVLEAARADAGLLLLRSGVFDPAAQSLDWSEVGAAVAGGERYAIVQFAAGSSAGRAALAALGVDVLGYVPNHAYYVRLNGKPLDRLRGQPGVRWAGLVQPGMKLAPELWRPRRSQSTARQADGVFRLSIQAFEGESSARIARRLREAVPQIDVLQRSRRAGTIPYLDIAVPADRLDALIDAATALDAVQYVSAWLPTTTSNAGGIAAVQGNWVGECAGLGPVCGPTPVWDQGLLGSGQIVAVMDSGVNTNAAWFATLDIGDGPLSAITYADDPPPVPPDVGALHPGHKIVAYWRQPGETVDYDGHSGHGTHTAGTLAGDAAGSFGGVTYTASTPWSPGHDIADGMAPNAQLLIQDAGGVDPNALYIADLQGSLEQAYAGGARIHSDSWGAPTGGAYTSHDEALDRVAWRVEDLLVVVAAGNNNATPVATQSPSNAKNSLTVGALWHAGSLSMASFTNPGPTMDGRRKPDLAAPGADTVSALGDGAPVDATIRAPLTQALSGTSMATPTVAGHAALARQYFDDGFYPRGFRNSAAALDVLFADAFGDAVAPPSGDGVPVDTYHPTGAALKAVLLNGTRPTVSPSSWPNTAAGWGRAWLDGSLWFRQSAVGGDDSRRLRLFDRANAAGLVTGEADEYVIERVEAGGELRVTLTWFDPAAAAGVASVLINNLDLELDAPDGRRYLGNRLWDGESKPLDEWIPGVHPDARDTVEQVRLTAPLAGRYVIRVKAVHVPGNGEQGSDRQGYALAVSGVLGLPDRPPLPAPGDVGVIDNGPDGVAIAAAAAAGAQGFQLYRADGAACDAADPGDFRLVAHGPGLPLTDTRTQGGYRYAYRLRGVQHDVEGQVSACVDAVSQDACSLPPSFDAALTATDRGASCAIGLSWQPAQSNCPLAADVRYEVERDADPYFGAPQLLAENLAATGYVDSSVGNGTPYHYRVYAVDGEGNRVRSERVTATPSGPDGPDPGAYLDDVDNASYATPQPPWQITDLAASDGRLAYRNAPDDGVTPDLACASLTLPAMTLTAGAVLTFQARYDLEYEWDGVVMEISSDGGESWQDLPPDGGYPSSFAQTMDPPVNVCGYAASRGAFSGVSTSASAADPANGVAAAVFRPFSADLSAYVGQNVLIRWRFSSDPATGYEGFYLDQVRISGAPGDGSHVCQ